MKDLNQRTLTFELLVDYVEGLLDTNTQSQIQERLVSDEYHRNIVEGIRFYFQQYGEDRTKLEAYLKDFEQRLSNKTKGNNSRKIRTLSLSIAASIALLLSIFFLVQNQLGSPSASDYVAQALEKPYGSPYTITKGTNEDSVRGNLSQLYQDGEYDSLVPILSVFLERTSSPRGADYLMLGLSNLYQTTPDYAAAISAFEAVLQADDTRLKEQAQWFKAIAQFKKEDFAAAKLSFEAIQANTAHYQQEQAAKILQGWP